MASGIPIFFYWNPEHIFFPLLEFNDLRNLRCTCRELNSLCSTYARNYLKNKIPTFGLNSLLKARKIDEEFQGICDARIKNIIPELKLDELLKLRKVNEEFNGICDNIIKNYHPIGVKKLLDVHQKNSLQEIVDEMLKDKDRIHGNKCEKKIIDLILNGKFVNCVDDKIMFIYYQTHVYLVWCDDLSYYSPEHITPQYSDGIVDIFET